ncbi:hypothetical protein DFR70_12382 [Nocardia tenerifensis]|uniref:Uncharacterized protein n=1 Tax=Nocardia tenerifensis TaxID=228006 RepID=A0A318KBN6_9NOCA|nr:DUF6301 family protein [Nocardia tenerifensis]PXX54788.1 hypothetical protein DFR70_12382 [Nocardia tenerifensis]
MQVDVEGAVRTARLAAQFDWTWYLDKDLSAFCDAAGWSLGESSDRRTDIRTDLRVRPPRASVARRRRMFDEMSVHVSDEIDRSIPWAQRRRSLVDAFAALGEGLTLALDNPTRVTPGESAMMSWECPRVWIKLQIVYDTVYLYLISQESQATADAAARYDAGYW